MAVYNSTYTGAQIDNLLLKSGGTMTGPLIINGTASSNPLVLRGITGSDGLGNPGDLYLNYQRAGFVDMLNNKVKVTATATYLNQLTELNGTLSVVDSYIIRNTVKYDGTMSNNGLSSGTEYPSTLIINDKNGLGLARVEGIIGSDGNIGVNMYARNYDSTGAQLAQCSIRAQVNKSGTPSYAISHRGAFREAIELTTTSSNVVSNIISVNTNNGAINTASYARFGNVVSLYIVWNNKNAIVVPPSGNITNIGVGNLVSGLRSAVPMMAGWTHGDDAGAAWFRIDGTGNNGAIYLGGCEGTGTTRTIAANSRFDIHTTYVIP